MWTRLSRLTRHLVHDRAQLRRAFPGAALTDIEARIAAGEQHHSAELRVAIEAALHPGAVWAGTKPRERALEVFGSLRVWDTEANNGVLIYVLLADRAVEIVADRAAARAIDDAQWAALVQSMSAAFRDGRHAAGVCEAIDRLNTLLAPVFPAAARNPDELPNAPAIL